MTVNSALRWLPGIVVLAAVSLSGYSDTIRVDDLVYENVYIGDGAQSYYIQNPADGSMITVPKSAVKESDIQITPDRDERRRLRDQWRLKRTNRTSDLPETTTPESWRDEISEAVPEHKPADAIVEKVEPRAVATKLPPPSRSVQITPQPVTVISSAETVPNPDAQKATRLSNVKNLGARLEGQKMFMDTEGVAVITNRPDQFEGRPEYVEVTIHFDPIEVPHEFRTPVQSDAGDRGLLGGSTIDDMIAFYARQHALDAALVYAVIKVESDGNQYAVSSAGARGLMQLMPGTAREMGVRDIFDPAENIAGGTQYLSKMLGLFNENTELALAGYNAGPGNVRKHGGVPPFKETQSYVALVQRYQRQYKRSGMPRFDVASSSRPVDKGYLPPESREFYQLVLDNGLTVAAEQIQEDGDRLIYWFKGRSGHFPAEQVISVREPTRS
jgi:hypothetical protein